jgi:hypothetical protein
MDHDRTARVRWLRSTPLLLAVLVSLAACEGGRSNGDPDVNGSAAGTSPSAAATVPASSTEGNGFDPANFGADSAVVDNPWFPLVPGTRYVWEGRAFDDEGQRVDRRVEFIVTDLTKVIDGIRTVVGWDRDFDDGTMGESELIFYAQDEDGTVWHLGEYVEHWNEGELDGGRLWVVGDPDGATAGIAMHAEPAVGTPEYSQGFAPPPWFWDDHAKVSEVGVRSCVPVGCFDDAIVIQEFEPRFPGAFQLKYYAQGVGGIRVGWKGSTDEEREVMVLTEFDPLSPQALAKARARVLEQEERGLAYGRLPPAEPRT